MPYITKSEREYLAENPFPDTPGQLNYQITQACIDYARTHGWNYLVYNELIGVLECVKLEMYRRALAPYEDRKIEENGDVYPKTN